MIVIKNFENYEFCPMKCEVFTAKGTLKSYFDKTQKFWFFYNGFEKTKVTLPQILMENWEEIQKEILRKFNNFSLT